MALIPCNVCGHGVSTSALKCPKCGAPPPSLTTSNPTDSTSAAITKVADGSQGDGPIVANDALLRLRKDPGVAAVMSFFFCGLGQFYNNDIEKGVVMMAPLAICGLAATLIWHPQSRLIALFFPSTGPFVPFMIAVECVTRGVILLSISLFLSLGLLLSWVVWSIVGAFYIAVKYPHLTMPPPSMSEPSYGVGFGIVALLIVAGIWIWSVNDAYTTAQEANKNAGLANPDKRARVAVALSLLWCGAGQIYNHEITKGLTMTGAMSFCLASMSMWFLGSFLQTLSSSPGSTAPSGLWLQVVGVIALVGAIATWLWGIVDAWRSAPGH